MIDRSQNWVESSKERNEQIEQNKTDGIAFSCVTSYVSETFWHKFIHYLVFCIIYVRNLRGHSKNMWYSHRVDKVSHSFFKMILMLLKKAMF